MDLKTLMRSISLNIEKGKVISIGRLKILIGLAPKNKPQSDVHVMDNACLCEQNARGQVVSGWCRKHHTDWM
tara:strand:+ start:51 stop:266 length:216 start_codon:yes stop_codon:yes gene_type:complete